MKQPTITLAQGFCMGAADVIPGVSGGTMAFILGIYQRLLEAIRAFDARLLRYLLQWDLRRAVRHTDLVFLVPLAAGIAAAVMFFTRVISLPNLIRSDPELIYGLFFGLILASVAVLMKTVQGLRAVDGLGLATGVALRLFIVNLVPVDTPEATWFIFVSGAFAICAMILPGISGAFVLLILKKYAFVLDAIGRLDLGVILPFGLGAIAGLLLFSRVLVWLLHHHYRRTLTVISGLLVGSLWVIWPFQERTYEIVHGKARLIQSVPTWPDELNATVAAAAALTVAGIAIVVGLHTLAGKRLHAA